MIRYFDKNMNVYSGPSVSPIKMQEMGFYRYDGVEPADSLVYDAINGKIRVMSIAEMAEKERIQLKKMQDSKSDRLKRNENAYLALLKSLPVQIEATDNSNVILQKLIGAGLTTSEGMLIAVQLLAAMNDIIQAGGSWDTLPDVPHEL